MKLFLQYSSPPVHISALLLPPLCIIHHIGLLPCFPGLFLPSMPVTLTESPQSPAAPNSKPLSIWIMDYIPLFPPSLVSTEPSLCFLSPLPFSQALYSCPHSCVFQSFILVFRAPREYQHYASLQSTLLGGRGGGNSSADIRSCISPSLSVTVHSRKANT